MVQRTTDDADDRHDQRAADRETGRRRTLRALPTSAQRRLWQRQADRREQKDG